MLGLMKNFRNYISIHGCSPIMGRRSWKVGKKRDRLRTDFQDLQLEIKDTLKFSSNIFASTLRYVVIMENCWNQISMYLYPLIAGKRSLIALKSGVSRMSECKIWVRVEIKQMELCCFPYKFIISITQGYLPKMAFNGRRMPIQI